MTHREKVLRFRSELEARGLPVAPMRSVLLGPPLYRFLWLARVPVPPPAFQSFLGVFATYGLFFLIVVQSPAWVLWIRGHRVGAFALTLAGAGATLFGLVTASITRLRARGLRLPPWGRYPAEASAEGS